MSGSSDFDPWGGATPPGNTGSGATTQTTPGVVVVPAALSPFEDPHSWDVIKVGGVECPGIFKFTTIPKRAYEWDKKKGKGTKGETKTFVQMPASEGKGKFYLWTVDHFHAWESFRALFKYDPTKKDVQAIEIYHPALAAIELHSVVTEYLGACESEGKGLYAIEWSFGEYFPASESNATGTPSGSKQYVDPPNGNTPGTQPKDGQSQLDKENEDLAKQAKQEGAI
jgi:hypothetical protein